MWKSVATKMRRALLLGLTITLLLSQTVISFANETATTMRLAKREGTVKVTNIDNNDIATIDNMKLNNGTKVATSTASYAWINFDDSKINKMDECSNVEIWQDGKRFELVVNRGSVAFNVSEKLKEDESMTIRTSTMMLGIRGTMGVVKVVDSDHTKIYLLEGHSEINYIDSVTEEAKIISIAAGQAVDIYINDKENVEGGSTATIKEFDEEEIDPFMVKMLAEESGLLERAKVALAAEGRLSDPTEEPAYGVEDSIGVNLDVLVNNVDLLMEYKEQVYEKHEEVRAEYKLREEERRLAEEKARRDAESDGDDNASGHVHSWVFELTPAVEYRSGIHTCSTCGATHDVLANAEPAPSGFCDECHEYFSS